MKNDEYKELKLPDEMTKEERKEYRNELLLNMDIEETEGKNTHNLIYNVIGLFVYILFTVLFCGGGILSILQDDIDTNLKIIGIIFFIAGLYIGYRAFLYGKAIKEKIADMKKEKKVVITLRNIGYFIYSLVFFTVIGMFSWEFINPNDPSFEKTYHIFMIVLITEALTGTILIYISAFMSMFHKNTKIIEIKSNKK